MDKNEIPAGRELVATVAERVMDLKKVCTAAAWQVAVEVGPYGIAKWDFPQPMAKKRVALVTGATGQIGSAVSIAFAERYLPLALAARTQDDLDALASLCIKVGSPRVIAEACDVSLSEDCEHFFSKADEIGDLGVLVHCAAIVGKGAIDERPLAEWMRELRVNLVGTYNVCRLAAMRMKKLGWGRIVLLSSINATRHYPLRSAYSASKAGVEGLARALALELGPYGVTVNCVAPGNLERGMKSSDVIAEFLEAVRRRTPTQRLTTAQDIVSLVAFLASEGATQINGQVIIVDGGFSVSAYPLELQVPIGVT